MKIIVAETAGFCFGVDRAVKLVDGLLDEGRKVCTLGPLIHNPQFVESLAARGVLTVDDPGEVPPGYVLVLRTHGVPAQVMSVIEASGIEYYDAACPFVKKIQDIAARESSPERPVLIAGDPEHPEVVALRSHCRGNSYVYSSAQELDALFETCADPGLNDAVCVAQTTFSDAEYKECVKKLKKHCTNARIFDTICNATHLRQSEAASLAMKCDAVIVIGGRNSSNTCKLCAVCRNYCRSYLIEDASELGGIDLTGVKTLGITAGASTPVCKIKEVLKTMSELDETKSSAELSEGQADTAAAGETETQAEEPKKEEDMSFAELMDESLKTMNQDQQVVGVVMRIAPNEIQVDIGRKQTGYVPIDEYSSDPTADPEKELKIGDKIDLIILKTNDAEGTVMCSKRRCDAVKYWEEVVKAEEDKAVLTDTVVEVISKGMIVYHHGIRIFIPASLSGVPKNGRLEDMLNKEVKYLVIELDKRRKRAVGSIKDATKFVREDAIAKFFATAVIGQKFEQRPVRKVTDFGVFVDLGGFNGMIYRTELSWGHVNKPSDFLKVGDLVDVFVKGLDPEKGNVSLGYRKEEDNPWVVLQKDYPVGSVVEAKIVRLMPFGAFAKIVPFDDLEGLIPISQISNQRIEKTQDALSIGDVVTVKIIKEEIEPERKRITLSIRALLDTPQPKEKKTREEPKAEDYMEGEAVPIEVLLANAEAKKEKEERDAAKSGDAPADDTDNG